MSASAMEGLPAAPTPRSAVFAVLQRIGRSLMMPITVLPAAALLLRLGQPDLLGKYTFVNFTVLAKAGGVLLDSLPLLFAVGVAIGFARRSDGSTALAAVVGYLVFNAVTMTMFAGSSIKDQVLSTSSEFSTPILAAPKPNPTGVIGGIIIGVTAALLYQRFHRVKLVSWLAFFGGRRFVPIVTAFAALIIGIIFGWVWPPIGTGLNNLGDLLTSHGAVGAGIYGAFNRLLLPFGLHHIVNSLVTGVTEPIEFMFLFVAPVLYGVHVVLTGASLWLAAALGVKDGFGFSAGLIDYLLMPGRDPEADADEVPQRERATVAPEPGPVSRDPDPQGGAAPA